MARYLVDTSVLIDYSKFYEPARNWLQRVIDSDDDVGTCSVIVAEFMSGIRPQDREDWDEVLANMAYWDIAYETATQAGYYRYVLARQGIQLQTPDALIAAVAKEQSAILVTNNARDFPMTDIDLLVP